LRILLLSWEFPPHVAGGLGKHVADLAPALAAHGIEVHVVTPHLRGGTSTESICPGATVHRVPCGPARDGDNIVTFSQHSNSSLERKSHELSAELGGFDLIHGHDWLVAYSSIALKYALKRPLVVTVHSMERGRRQGDMSDEQALAINGTEWWLTYEAWRVITVSNYMREQVETFFGVPRDKLDVIYNGVNPPSGPPLVAANRAKFRSAYAAADEPIVYYVGRIVYEKGVHVLVNAAPAILRDQPRTRFVIAGTGPMLDTLRQQTVELGLADRFVFTGYISDEVRDKLYQVANVAVFPSLYEPFGIVALEAMAYNCPIVVTQTGGLAEFVRPHENGIMVYPDNPSSLAWGILHTLHHPEWAALRAANALRDVKSIYNWDRIATQTIETYRRIHTAWQHTAWGR
jgi:glycosyltransferase involved in cell wall biosynthesis